MKRYVEVRVQVVGFHRWPEAPQHVKFLGDPHRHTFHIRVRAHVASADRAIEFTDLRCDILAALNAKYSRAFDGLDFRGASCEQIAEELALELERHHSQYAGVISEIGVSEDGEFEGIVVF